MSAVATAVRERPLLMSGAMVRAILDDRKTQTRRVVKRFPRWFVPPRNESMIAGAIRHEVPCPYGAPGWRLWVRETWCGDQSDVRYVADGDSTHNFGRWRPSIHMPRWACRLVLELTDVRVERLQDISTQDCRAEGVYVREFDLFGLDADGRREVYQLAYRRLWDSLNAKRGYGWDVNPWVWVLTFRRVESAR